MARIRTVKPELWADEKLAGLPRDARLLFIGMFNFADDEGRMRGSPALIRAQVFPYDADVDVGEHMESLAKAGLLQLYQHDGQSFVFIVNFLKHQLINHPSKSVLPKPPTPDGVPVKRSRKDPVKLPDDSGMVPGGKGREGKGVDQGKEGNGEHHASAEAPPLPGRTVETRKAYETSYFARYGVEPVKPGRKGNGQLADFVDRVGLKDGPPLAAFYVEHNAAEYVNARHPLNLLARDVEKLHGDWKLGDQMTMTQARQQERSQENANGWMRAAKGGK